MTLIDTKSARRFVKQAVLPPLPQARSRGRTRDAAGAGTAAGAPQDAPPLQLKSSEAQTLVVGGGLVVAGEKVPVQTRADMINCMLFAQLVATGQVSDPGDVMGWYDAYFQALGVLGWAQSDRRFEDYHFASTNAEAHEAVVPVLMTLLGPAATALAVVKAALDGLKSMEENTPWITLFDSQSRSERSAHFQVATAEVGADGLLQVALVAFDLRADSRLDQVLFFKFARSKTQLRYAAGKATIYEAALAEQREDVSARLGAYRQAYVRQVKLPPLPALPPLAGTARSGPRAMPEAAAPKPTAPKPAVPKKVVPKKAAPNKAAPK